MVNESSRKNSGVLSGTPHKCGLTCLGPLAFHCDAVGAQVCLSEGGRLAQRTAHTFKNGLVFSSRPVRVNERIRLRVERDVFIWNGALRVGFTTVSPLKRRLPLPCVAVPNLTDRPGHWAGPVHEAYCQEGSELEFWVSSAGTVYVKSDNGAQHKLLAGVDLSKPLWAMIDIYGQTCSVFLLGSEKRGLFYTRRSCPAAPRLSSPDVDILTAFRPGASSIYQNKNEKRTTTSVADTEKERDEVCVVCLEKEATIALPCGHQCLCDLCGLRVIHQFDSCPLCRHRITALSLQGLCVSR